MSALAARRAAQIAQGGKLSPIQTTGPSSRASTRTKAPSVSSGSSESGESDISSDGEAVAGPSKRARLPPSALKPRYYAAPIPDEPLHGASGIAGPSRPVKRKRAYSPGAPMASDEDSSAAEEEDHGRDVDGGIVGGFGHNSLAGPSRTRASDGVQPATTTFSSRRGVNVELLSAAVLQNAGLGSNSGSGLIISLSSSESISLAGVFQIIPIQGAIDIFSTTLTPFSDVQRRYDVFAPTSHPVPAIAPATAPATTVSPLLARLQLPTAFDRSPTRSIFIILEYHTGIEGMKCGAIPGFNTIWGEDKGWMGLKGVHAVPGSILSTCYPYTTSSSWSTALESLKPSIQVNGHSANGIKPDTIEDSPIVLVKGPKRSGKSTMARAALNTLLSTYERVAWLECDLGQGEFGCGGVIGLWILDQPIFGPPFTHPRQAERAHFLGTYTPLTCPDEYLAAIDHLLQYYRYEIQYPSSSSSTQSSRRNNTVPLVINTQGWVKGLGEELLRALEGFAQATHIFAFDSVVDESTDRRGWTSSPTLPPAPLPFTSSGRPPNVFTLEPAPSTALQARYTAIDHRTLSTLSYFHSSLPSPQPTLGLKWDFSTPLIATPPYEVILGEAIKSIYLIGEGSDGVVPQDLSLALNGSLVALVEIQHLDPSTEIYIQNRSLPSLDEINFIGYGIIRAINGGKLHILTPLPTSSLARVNTIVKNGAMEIPTQGMLDWRDRGEESGTGILGVPWDEVPFFDTGSGGVGVERRRWRRNLMRKGM